MAAYWLLFCWFAIGAVRGRTRTLSLLFPLGILLLSLAVGLRYRVGADWPAYEQLFAAVRFADLGQALSVGDPGYQFVNWAVQRVGGGFWLVNLACAGLFAWGLNRFARAQPDPWLCMLLAIPYVVVVVAMGYTRQSVAIGILLAGLAAVERGAPPLRFAAYVAAAALFHRTAILLFPLVLLAGVRNWPVGFIVGALACFIAYRFLLAGSVDGFLLNYVESGYSSRGAAVRIAMDLVAAVSFFLFRSGLGLSRQQERLWKAFSLASFAAAFALLLLPSTAVDRTALYLVPLQLSILPRLRPIVGRLALLAYAFAVQFTWLNFADHAGYWLPYRVFPLFA